MQCFACRTEVGLGTGERVSFRDACASCGRDLHACLNCAHHDPGAYNECRESSAEPVRDRESANRCEYFRPGEAEGEAAGGLGRDAARDALEDLFKKK